MRGAIRLRSSGSNSGVFIGIGGNDYALLQARGNSLEDIDAYLASGTSHSVAAGRLSYFLGFQGPSIAIDTACSSSLVAIHQACASLRLNECRLALAGGANLILTPDLSVNFCRARMLSPDGVCRTFDAGANGYVRGEGVALIALKRLADAQADGDRIYAVIRGSAINQDGRSTGLTVPNGPAQTAVIQRALENANLEPRDVHYVEAHGTGTPLGDPIEVQAMAAALGDGRSADTPLLIGSIKTNLGHLESAAGVAGLLEGGAGHAARRDSRAPALQDAQSAHRLGATAGRGDDHAPALAGWQQGRRCQLIWIQRHQRARDSRGGAGCHAERGGDSRRVRSTYLRLSAKDERALKSLATHYEAYFAANPTADLAQVCYTASAGRAHFNHRLAITAADAAAARAELNQFLRGAASPRVQSAHTVSPPQIAFLFTGQGSQYPGMGRELYESEPVFREVMDRCAQALSGELEPGLLEVMWGAPAHSSLLDQTRYTQPALYALEVAMASLWRSWGVEPAVVLGHSVGEYAAACVAGVFSIEEGARLVAGRARLMQGLPAGGGMLAVQGDSERVRSWSWSGRSRA